MTTTTLKQQARDHIQTLADAGKPLTSIVLRNGCELVADSNGMFSAHDLKRFNAISGKVLQMWLKVKPAYVEKCILDGTLVKTYRHRIIGAILAPDAPLGAGRLHLHMTPEVLLEFALWVSRVPSFNRRYAYTGLVNAILAATGEDTNHG